MNCGKIQDMYQLYMENRLDSKTKEELENHLKGCANCSQFLKEFKGTVELLKTLGEKELPNDYFKKLDLKLAGAQTVLQSNPRLFLGLKQSIYISAIGIMLLLISIGLYFKGINKKVSIVNIDNNDIEAKIEKPTPQEPTRMASIPKKETKKENIQPKSIETKKTIELAKVITDEQSQIVLRGAGPKYKMKRIIKQWQDTNSGIKEKESLIIKTQQKWHELWKEHNGNIDEIPEIDFNKNMVIAVFMGEKKTGGYGIQISQIEESDDKIYIETIETVPASGNKQFTPLEKATDKVGSVSNEAKDEFSTNNADLKQQLYGKGREQNSLTGRTQPYHIVVINKD